jgi:hypothetical protein
MGLHDVTSQNSTSCLHGVSQKHVRCKKLTVSIGHVITSLCTEIEPGKQFSIPYNDMKPASKRRRPIGSSHTAQQWRFRVVVFPSLFVWNTCAHCFPLFSDTSKQAAFQQ